ncbi:MAG: HAD-IA family hydrolase [Patescibacteria group bacterium]
MKRKYKIIFTAQDPGGFNAIAPVIKKLEKDKRFNMSVILAKHACLLAEKLNIKYSDAGKKSFNINGADLVFTGTSFADSIEKIIIAMAKAKNIPTISIVDFWTDYAPSFSDPETGNLKYLPDYILAVDEIMKKQMTADGLPANKIFITGNPYFDSFSKIILHKPNKAHIAFFSQPFSEIYKNSRKDYKNCTKFDEVQVFEDIVKALEKIDLNKKIIINFHPRSKKLDKFDKIIKNSNIKIEKEKKPYNKELIKKSEIIAGINSVVLFEAAMLGKKVLSYQPNLKGADLLISNRFGLSTPVYKKEELYPILKKMLFQTFQKNNSKLIKKYTENKSTQKVINFITKIFENNPPSGEKKLKVIACIQARMGSKRLKGKALLKISGKSLIENMFRRLKAAKEIDDIVLATVNSKENDILAEHAEKIGLKCHRGSEYDLISRQYESAKKFNADALLLVTGDCPFVDPEIVDEIVKIYKKNYNKFDFFTNSSPPTFPHGLDMDIIPVSTFERLDREMKNPFYRECYGAYIMEHPKKFRIYNLKNSVNLSTIRLTLDYPEDLILTRKIFNALDKKNKIFGTKDILEFLKQNPQILEINKKRIDMVIVKNIRSKEYHSIKNRNTVILDFDRTIADLKVNWVFVRKEMENFCAKNGVKADFSHPKPIYEIAKTVSKTKKFYADLLSIVNKEELKSAEKAELMPGAKDFLEFLHINDIPFAILSNNNSQCIVEIFKKFKLPKPKIIIGSDDVKYLKPHPEGLNKILKRMKIKNNQCLLIGDSASELQLGRVAGIKTFIIPSQQMKNFNQLKSILI